MDKLLTTVTPPTEPAVSTVRRNPGQALWTPRQSRLSGATPVGASDHAQELLRRFLGAQDEHQADRLLERLIQEHAEPIIQAVVRRKMEVHLERVRRLDRLALGETGGPVRRGQLPPKSIQEFDAEEVHASTVLSLLEQLRAVKSLPAASPIQDFRAYVGRMTLNAFAQHMRQRCRERYSLRRKLGYLTQVRTSVSRFAIWPGRNAGEQLYGFQDWKGLPLGLGSTYRAWQQNPDTFREAVLAGLDPHHLPLSELVTHVLNWVGEPIEVDHLVQGLVELLGLKGMGMTHG